MVPKNRDNKLAIFIVNSIFLKTRKSRTKITDREKAPISHKINKKRNARIAQNPAVLIHRFLTFPRFKSRKQSGNAPKITVLMNDGQTTAQNMG